MAKQTDTANMLRSLQRVHKALKEHHAKAADMHDEAEGYVEKLLGDHEEMQGGAETVDHSGTFEREPSAGSRHPDTVKMARHMVSLPNGDRDLDEEAKRRLAKKIYSNPLPYRP